MIDPPAADRVACPECGRNLVPAGQVLPEHTVPGPTETGLSNRRCDGSLAAVPAEVPGA
jgi:hypothetical protein